MEIIHFILFISKYAQMAGQIDMNMQSEMMAAFEESLERGGLNK